MWLVIGMLAAIALVALVVVALRRADARRLPFASTGPAHAVRERALRARRAIAAGEARWREIDRASISELSRRFETGADQLVSRLENRILGLALLAKVRSATRNQLNAELERHARETLPGADAFDAVIFASRRNGNHLIGDVRQSLGVDASVGSAPRARRPVNHLPGGLEIAALATVAGASMPALIAIARDSPAEALITRALNAVQEVAMSETMEVVVEEFGEEVAEEVAEAVVGILVPAIGWAVAGWTVIKYGSKIKRIFFDKEPLTRVRASVREAVLTNARGALASLDQELEASRRALIGALYDSVDAWEAQTVGRGRRAA